MRESYKNREGREREGRGDGEGRKKGGEGRKKGREGSRERGEENHLVDLWR